MSIAYPGNITDQDGFRELVETFEEQEQRDYYYERALETVNEEFAAGQYHSDELILGGPMLLLYTWNFAAIETKTMEKEALQAIFRNHEENLRKLRGQTILEADLHPDGNVGVMLEDLWDELKDCVGQTGTSKILSLVAPELFVMWDQDIRTRRSRSTDDPPGHRRPDRGVYFYMKESGHTVEHNKPDFGKSMEDYLAYLRYCKEILKELGEHPLIDGEDETAAKRLDEALYAFYKLTDHRGTEGS
jgi:hypothetical protein